MIEHFYPESQFGGFTQIDGTVAFYTRVQALIRPDAVVLDFGCGRGAYGEDPILLRRNLRIFKGKARQVIGLDVSEAGTQNPYLDTFDRIMPGEAWPLKDCSVDLCVCDNVLEHLESPAFFFSEARRVLHPQGILCIRTPNRWNYIALFSQLIPNRQHARVLSRAKNRSNDEDVFPTWYRCNSLPVLRRMFSQYGFAGPVYGYEAEPSYLAFSKAAYALGVLHQKLAPGFLRAAIFAFGRLKKES